MKTCTQKLKSRNDDLCTKKNTKFHDDEKKII